MITDERGVAIRDRDTVRQEYDHVLVVRVAAIPYRDAALRDGDLAADERDVVVIRRNVAVRDLHIAIRECKVSRLPARCENAEQDLVKETPLRPTAEADLVRANEVFFSVHDSNQVLRAENEGLVDCDCDRDVAVAEQARAIQGLKDRCRSSEADCAAVMRYNAELTTLRQYLDEHSCGKLSPPSPRTKAELAENTRLWRANSVLHRNSAERGLNTDALVLATAGISVSGID
ncbi:hypothetical protein PHMEG_0007315 [Phytophthora megakarya]|uniref:Uncharacterized protein n=1 Tax=Phytophthora megakarya TaxID=4795 RepID=A0A225WLL5_9STRA|nr:hypothetical protein PHMEG_0007315 [Phytophthora megakarya]